MTKRHPILTKAQWQEYAAKAKTVNRLVHELRQMRVRRVVVEPYLKRIERDMFLFGCMARCEMHLQYPQMAYSENAFTNV